MRSPYRLFERFGVELEYMIVDARTLSVRPWADRLIQAEVGDVNGDVTRGALAWSNELALHLIELKTSRPARSLNGLAERFQAEVIHVNQRLASEGAMLLPTAMHPWMNPARESRLWPHECGDIYRAFDRIFDCRGHGWTNLQSAHLNLPFAGDSEFERLHTGIRLILPLLPALAASSPFVEGRRGASLDMRLEAYRRNCAKVPSISGAVVPEWMASPADYQQRILKRIYADLAIRDPEGVLHHEWVNARGAIARFERHTIEIRLLDLQECPAADLAILAAIVAVLKHLTDPERCDPDPLRRTGLDELADLLKRVVRSGGRARVRSRAILKAVGANPSSSWSVRDLWIHLIEAANPGRPWWRSWIDRILQQGCLSERIVKTTGTAPSRTRLRTVYRRLAECLASGQAFVWE